MNHQNPDSTKSGKIITNKFTYSLDNNNNNNNKKTNFNHTPCPESCKIIDERTLDDFKKQSFGGHNKTTVNSEFEKAIKSENVERAIYLGFQLYFSGLTDQLWNKLLGMAGNQVNILNPRLPYFLLEREIKWKTIINSSVYKNSQAFINIRNNQELRNLLTEMIAMISLSRKNKIESSPKIILKDFEGSNFKSKLEAVDTTLTKYILKEKDPSEIRIVINELAHQLKSRNLQKTLYWYQWILEWEKKNVKQYKKFEIGCRYYENIDNKYSKNVIWLIWDLIHSMKDVTNFSTNEKEQIDNLWKLYIYDFKIGDKGRKSVYIVWCFKYLTSYCDWKIELVDRKYVLFQSLLNINIMIQEIKRQEKKDPTTVYQQEKFNLIIQNNYMTTENSVQLKKEQIAIQRYKAIEEKKKEAKKKKVSVQSLSKMEQLKELDRFI
jgi:hypothetical protein